MLYAGYLIDLGWTPYLDFFDMNTPGTYFLNWLVYRAIGDSDLGFRAIEFLTLGLIGVGAWLYLRPFGRAVALAAPMLFVIHQLLQGPIAAFQRDLICTVPLAFAIVLAFRTPHWSLVRRSVAIGLLAGAIVSIRPQLLTPGPILFIGMLVWDAEANWQRLRDLKRWIVPAFAFLSSAVIVPALSLVILAYLGGLEAFLEMVSSYWPLYSQLRGDATLQSVYGRIFDLIRVSNKLSHFTFFGLAAIGLALGFVALTRATRRIRVEFITLAMVATTLLLAVAITGKLWYTHLTPVWYFLGLAAGLAIMTCRDGTDDSLKARIVIVALLTVQPLSPPWHFREFVTGQAIAVKLGDVDEIADFLRQNLKPGDVVQPLDVTGGAIHGMFLARAELATPFLYDFHFYHHPDDPYIRQLRHRLTAGMNESCARFVIEFRRPWRPKGPGTAAGFPELDVILENYEVALDSDSFRILERRPDCVRTDLTARDLPHDVRDEE
jgi:hypothetical protein